MSNVLGDRPVGQQRPGGGLVLSLLGGPRPCRDDPILVTAKAKFLQLLLLDNDSRRGPLPNFHHVLCTLLHHILTNLQC